jgi:hypothetical protein
MIPWNESLNLSEFYKKALDKGFVNNSSKELLVDCFNNEELKQVWILYNNENPIGSVAAHSIDEGVRICARTCVLTDQTLFKSLRTRSQITCHQHITAQFFIPVCIEWAKNKDMYITTHNGDVGTQRLVHSIWAPTLEKTGVLSREFEKEYRGHLQTFWKLNSKVFLEQLERYPRWINCLSSPKSGEHIQGFQ